MRLFCFLSLSVFFAISLVSCETIKDDHPTPQREELSSMPHNMPASWEGTQGMPGMPGMQQQY
ncbi:MAG: hypothetical protein HRU46_09610 [Verrucomicrobiales bacterium]|nr:hypothetical protein [Verrucomicrobiales bacterium]